MSNQLYDVARERMLNATLNWPTLSIKLHAFNLTSYVFTPSHTVLNDVGVPVATSLAFTGQVVASGGYAKSGAAYFSLIPVGPAITFFILAEDTGTPTTNKLIGFFNEGELFPFTPAGIDYTIDPDWLSRRGWWRA